MATELPLFNRRTEVIHSDQNLQEATLQDDAFLQELLGVPEDDLLTSLLESANATNSTDPPLNFDFDFNPLLNVPTSPVNSDFSMGNSPDYSNQANSPSSLTSGSDFQGDSLSNSSPSPYIVPPFSSSVGRSEPTFTTLMASTEQMSSSSPAQLSSDITIDLDYMTTAQKATRQEEASTEWDKLDMKAHTLILTEEEKKLLVEEGVTLPTDMPLTKAEQKHLKRVRRKIKNKISAQESRKRKKEYVDGLENRVQICTNRNKELSREVDCLRQQNYSLMTQLKKLQAMVSQCNPSKVQAGSVMLVVVMSFAMFFVPKLKQFGGPQAVRSMSHGSRALLFTVTDDFGNVIDPDSGNIISRAGGTSPNFPPPWVRQTPVLGIFSTRHGPPDDSFRGEYLPGTIHKERRKTRNKEEIKPKLDNSSNHNQEISKRDQTEDWTYNREL